ncbi:MAG: UDP binding domain-containing protein, partial [Acidobacteriota bacterium]
GVSFKRDVDDARNSPAERVIELLLERGALVRYHDPYVPVFRVGSDVFQPQQIELKSVPLTRQALRGSDAVVIVTPHRAVDYELVIAHSPLIVDSSSVTAGMDHARRIVRLGAPEHVGKTKIRRRAGGKARTISPEEPGDSGKL